MKSTPLFLKSLKVKPGLHIRAGKVLISIIVVSLFSILPTSAQDVSTEIDNLFSQLSPDDPGCVCAVSYEGKLIYDKAFGLSDIEQNESLKTNSKFDLASVRKQFISAAVLLLVEENVLSLNDDIRMYFPELPDYGHTITVDHLLTHTSGIRDWTGFYFLANSERSLLELILRQQAINFVPGEEWSYSNSNYVLLTELVARASRMNFGEFVLKKIFQPLGMHSTVYAEAPYKNVEDRCMAYEKEGETWTESVYLGEERGQGSGAIFSTAKDLTIWGNAVISGRLSKYVSEQLQEPTTLNNGRKLTYGRGIMVEKHTDGNKWLSHSGNGAGYSAWLGIMPEHKLSVAVLCNFNPVSATGLGHRITNLFAGEPSTATGSVHEHTAKVKPEESELSEKEGIFLHRESGDILHILVHNGQLRIPGGPPLVSVSNEKFRNPEGELFFRSQDEFELVYHSNDEIEYTSMEGVSLIYQRVIPFTPAVEELREFEGRYINEDLQSFFEIKSGQDGLELCLNGPNKCIKFTPLYPDNFTFRRMKLNFQKNETGKVTGLLYSNPVLRNMLYTKVRSTN